MGALLIVVVLAYLAFLLLLRIFGVALELVLKLGGFLVVVLIVGWLLSVVWGRR